MDGRAAALVRQGEVHAAVAAERRAEQREQRLVLVDRKELAVAHRPTLGREVEAHDPDLGQERLSHAVLRSLRGRMNGPAHPSGSTDPYRSAVQRQGAVGSVGCWQAAGPDSSSPEKFRAVGLPTFRPWM